MHLAPRGMAPRKYTRLRNRTCCHCMAGNCNMFWNVNKLSARGFGYERCMDLLPIKRKFSNPSARGQAHRTA